jgi:3,5-epimerase/4-reductase
MIVFGFLFGKIFSKIGDIKTFILFKPIDIIYIIINYMKVLLFGRNGWIGSQVYDLLINSGNHEVINGNERAENYTELEKEIKNVNPTHIISLIGRTHGTICDKKYTTIDYLEQPGKLRENIRDNLYSPLVLAILSKKYNIHYTYLGTGCIFKYDDEHPFGKEENGFNEDDSPNFFESEYSTVKGYTDKLMHLFDNVLNIRIRMPITSNLNPRNFITKIISYENICSVPNSMTVLDELLPVMIDMAEKRIMGTINLTNPGLISHNEILEMYKEIIDENFTWKNYTIDEQNKILAAGRSNNYLDTTRLEQLYPNVKNIKESVRECLEKMK